MKVTLHRHAPKPHAVQNPNDTHMAAQEKRMSAKGIRGFNERFAVWLVDHVGTMGCFYIFQVLGTVVILALFGVFGKWSPLIGAVGGALSSYDFQLVLLPGMLVGQNIQGRKSEHQSDAMYQGIMNAEHEDQQMAAHLSKQDTVIVGTLVGVLLLLGTLVIPNVVIGVRHWRNKNAGTVSLGRPGRRRQRL